MGRKKRRKLSPLAGSSEVHVTWGCQGWIQEETCPPSTPLNQSTLLSCAEFVSDDILKVKGLVTQSCPALCYPMVCSLPDSSVHGILQARILEWIAIPFSRDDILVPFNNQKIQKTCEQKLKVI